MCRVQTEASAAQQSTILQGIENIQLRQDKLQRSQVEIGRQFLHEMRRYVGNADRERWRKDLIGAIHRGSHTALQSPARSPEQENIRKWLLKSLKFQEMGDRELRITNASKNTFKWIYEAQTANLQPRASFPAFLEQDDSGIYWITGKPGSGKSTLMKYLIKNHRTFDFLRRWAPGGVIASAFYFWNSGMNMQMSIEGLLRTLLANCLEQLPRSVIERLFPGRWEALSLFGMDDTLWTWRELSLALRKLVLDVCCDRKFFFFVDGLDEFSGDHGMLTDLILDLVSSAPNVKACVASRPWVNFEDAFRSKPHLMLQDLTKRDIELYITSTFRKSQGFLDLEQREPRHAERLVAEIAQKAEGVFLWVRLVVKSLLVGMTNGDRIRELRKRLERTPSNLEDLFKKMLHSLEPRYLQHASQIFQIHRASEGPLTMLTMAFADLEDQDEVLRRLLCPPTHSNLTAQCTHMKRKLSSRCKGLLEVDSLPMLGQQNDADGGTDGNKNNDDRIMDCKVQYLHRTVKDFIQTPEVWDWIVTINQEPFDPFVAHGKSHLLLLKSMNTTEPAYDETWGCAMRCIYYAKRSELDKGLVQTKLMDELDRTATALTRHRQSLGEDQELHSWSDGQPHWTSAGIPAVEEPSFVYLMAMCGMSGYLEAKLAHDDPELQDYGDNKTPLLFAVLEDYVVLEQFSVMENITVDPSCKETIRVLLRKGADPYQLHRGRSAQTVAKTMASRGDRDFIEVLRILNEYGRPASRRGKRLGRQTQPLPGERGRPAPLGLKLTVENICRIDRSHGKIPPGHLIAQNGSALGNHFGSRSTSPEHRYPEGRIRTYRWVQFLRSLFCPCHEPNRSY